MAAKAIAVAGVLTLAWLAVLLVVCVGHASQALGR
jgi:hypothetical protein